MSNTKRKALQKLYKKMTGNDAEGKTIAKVLNEIATSMGTTVDQVSIANAIDEITDNYTPGGSGGVTTSTLTVNATVASGADPSMQIITYDMESTESMTMHGGVFVVDGGYQVLTWDDDPVLLDNGDNEFEFLIFPSKAIIVVFNSSHAEATSVSGSITRIDNPGGFLSYAISGDATISVTIGSPK